MSPKEKALHRSVRRKELQSTNEELETSKEELRSLNEELSAVNAQLEDKVRELTGANDDLANLLASADIAVLLVDTSFCIRRFTAPATRLLNLTPSDLGRSVAHITHHLVDVDLDLRAEAETVLRTLQPTEKEVRLRNGSDCIVRMLPYRTGAGLVQGVVFTFIDVSDIKAVARLVGTVLTHQHADAELRELNESLERRVADRTRWLTLLHDATKAVSEAPDATEALRRLLVQICRAEQWQVGCVYLPEKDAPDELSASVTYAADPRFAAFAAMSTRTRFRRSQPLPGWVFRDQHPVLVDGADEVSALLEVRSAAAKQAGLQSLAAVPVRVDGQPIGVLELFSDRSHPPSDDLVNLLDDVGAQIGRALERDRLMAQVAEMVWREQQDLVHTLHDSLGQELTGIGLLSASLGQRCRDDHPGEAETARQIADGARRALDRVRQLSRGLFPVEVEAGALPSALQQLASTTANIYKVSCDVRCADAVPVADNHVATQLYRIAQEAVTNALRHGHPRTITIEVARQDGGSVLSVADDGVGIGGAPSKEGTGLRIMAYRAMTIGGRLAVGPCPDGGTMVRCILREPAAGKDDAGRDHGSRSETDADPRG